MDGGGGGGVALVLTIDIKRISTGTADICVDLGRPAIVSINLGIIDALSQFMSGLIIPSSHQPSPSPPRPGTANPVSRLASMSNISLTTREVTLEVSAVSHPDEPSITVSAASARIGTQFRDSLRKVDANVTVEGLLMSCMLQQKCFYLIKPFAFDGDLEMTFSPHSLSDAFPSLPQVCTRLNIALVQVDIGQEHVRCLSLLSDLIQQHVNDDPSSMEGKTDISESKTYTMEDEFESKEGNTDIKERSTAAKEKGTETKGSEAVSMVSDPDYKRNDTFTLGSVSKNNESQRDTKGKESDTKGNKTGAKGREAVIKNRDTYINGTETDTKENEWRTLPGMDANDIGTYVGYCPNGRKIGGSEDRVRRQQRAGDSARRSFDDLRTGPFTYLSEQGYQTNKVRCVGAETGSAYSSPYRGLISPTSLAASAKVNSVFTSALIPAVSAQISIGVLELKLVNHTNTEKQDLPSYLDDYKLYPSLPPEQEFLLLTVEGLSGVSKHLGGVGAVTLAQFEWNCHCDLIDFGDLTYRRFLSPCDVRSTSALYHGNLKCPSFCADVQSERRSLWLESGVEISSALVHVSQSTVHTAALAAEAWGQEKEVSLFSHYVICNETQQALRLGQGFFHILAHKALTD
ncbi:predicted protein [Nematostella vectensis]|uniref:Uncharacterized protein n=1 Tax=Nematostella vectensis TaxID=45351 RepID=A7SZF6_NEMVE|nr:predicted protein [Nematostella vectensis]|eukprot:XP_001623006.1 hypothetical protein NEMVEDRAFT_v1g219952 [Nematostella vectensis]